MKDPLQTWYYRGREARGRGLPRELPDGRISAENRASWGRGWDDEDTMRAPKPTEAEVEEFNAFFRGLAAEVRSNILPITVTGVEDEMIALCRGEYYVSTLFASDPSQAVAFHQAHTDTTRDTVREWQILLEQFQRSWRSWTECEP